MRRVALVTGGSRGIGAACVRAFAQAGYAVIFLYHHRQDAAEKLTRELCGAGMDVSCRACDVADFSAVQTVLEELLRTYRHVDVLVNCAGVAYIGLLTEMTEQAWDRLFAVDVKALFNTCKAVLPAMVSRRSGAIVNVGSMWGTVGASCEVAYSAAKAAVDGFTKALAKEVGPSGVRVNSVSPGVIDTDMNAELDEAALSDLAEETPLCRIGRAQEVAKVVLFLAGEDASFITGQCVGVNGGMVT